MTLDQFKKQLMADRKKAGMLLGLCMFGLLLWGRLLWREVPRTATATPSALAASPASDSPAAGGVAVEVRKTLEVAFNTDLKRDLFALDEARYPRPEPVKAVIAEKSAPKPADDLEERQNKVREQARGLKLQTTMLGATPRAMIQGSLLKVGESIQGFEIVEIRSRRVVVKKDGVRIELEM